MCGVSAYFDFDGQRQANGALRNDVAISQPDLERRLRASVRQMRHRGPDAEGVWTSRNATAGLGHVRLATRDLTASGHQPLHSASEEDDIHIVVNGELYYDSGLRDSLDYEFQSTSDSEIVIPLYKKFGTGLLSHLRGEFSLVLYDGKKRMMIAARDRFGVKPLHYRISDGRVLIATQAKSIASLCGDSGEQLEWDLEGIAEGGGHYGPKTVFKGIRKFPPGHLAVFQDSQSSDEVRFQPYYQVKYAANEGGRHDLPTGEVVSEARARIIDAVRIRYESADVPVGILLSGGVDSSAVAGIAAHVARQRIEKLGERAPALPTCFTLSFPEDNEYDESAIAARTAKHLGLPLETLVVTEELLADNFEEACLLGETLLWDLQHVAKKALSRYISSRGFRVVLNGDGGDELFGGYPFFAADRLLQDDGLRATHLQQANPSQRTSLQKSYQTGWFGTGKSDDQSRNPNAQEAHLPPSFCNLAVPTYHDWLVEEVRQMGDPFEAILHSFGHEELANLAEVHPLRRSMLAWNKTMLPNVVISAISDGAEMAHGVESRPPFLDHVLADFANTLPVDFLVHLQGDESITEKWVFREAIKPFITAEVYHRRKQTFAAPFKYKFGGPLYLKLASLVNRKSLVSLGFVDVEKAEVMLREAFEKEDQALFRNTLWLAEIVSIGQQFSVRPRVLV